MTESGNAEGGWWSRERVGVLVVVRVGVEGVEAL